MTPHLRPLAAAARLATAVTRRARRRRCPLCEARLGRHALGPHLNLDHTPGEVAQHAERIGATR